MKKKKEFEIKRNAQLQLRRAVPTIIFSIWWRDTIFKFYFYWIRTRDKGDCVRLWGREERSYKSKTIGLRSSQSFGFTC